MTGVFPLFPLFTTGFKKHSKLDYSNDRIISLLSNIEKTLEKHMYKRLYIFLNNSNFMYNRQQYSSSHALINITENIRKALDDGNISCGDSLD